MLATVSSATLLGIDGLRSTSKSTSRTACPVTPSWDCRTPPGASRASGFAPRCCRRRLAWPQKRITVNLSPATVNKTGAGLELAIALGLLVSESQLPAECLEGVGVLGELGFDGSIRPVPGTLILADALMPRRHRPSVIVPPGQRRRGRVGPRTARALRAQPRDPPRVLEGRGALARIPTRHRHANRNWTRPCRPRRGPRSHHRAPRARDRRRRKPPPAPHRTTRMRQDHARPTPRHDPGAVRRPTNRSRSPASRPSATASPPKPLATRRPVQAPHHTATTAAIVGGGSGRPRPGELSRAHRGVLFLDELGEFPPMAINALRQPLEEGVVRIARQGGEPRLPGVGAARSPARIRVRAGGSPSSVGAATRNELATPIA